VAQTRGLSDSILAAAVVAGPSATQADLATATGYVRSLDGIMVDETPPAAEGPGYVMATGQGGGVSWRLEAAITSFDHQDGAPTVGAVMATTTSVDTGSRTVDLSTSQRVNDDYIDLGPAGIVQFGTATSEVSGIDIVDPSGGIQSAHRFSWPAALGSLPGVLAAPTGWLWYASAAERGTVRPLMASAPTAAPTGDPGASLEPGELPMKETSNGFVIYGNDLGHDWQLAHENGRMELFLDGSTESAGSFTFVIGSETQIDVPGGAFLISLRDKTVTDFAASIDATDQQPSTTIDGGWQRIQDVNGDDGRVWIVPLPGWGTGTEQANDDLPNFVSWPSSPLRDGTLLSGGSDGVVSWGLSWRNDHCVVLETIGADPGNSGSSECLPPWTDLKNNPLIGGVYGSTRATVAMVLTHRPPTTTTSPDLNDGALQCDNIDMESNFAGTTICVFPVDVGHPVEIHVSQEAGPLNEVVALEAEPGRLNQIQPGTTDATSSPSTVP